MHALVGENGAGKSTLVKLLAGVVKADHLELQVAGEPVALQNPADAKRLGFRFIHQELNLVPGLSVAENIFLGHTYPLNRFGTVAWKTLSSRAQDTLKRLGVTHIAVQASAASLSTGDAMLISLARAFVDHQGAHGSAARLFVMDEPTAALSRTETELLFRVIRSLRAEGSSVLYVSHRLSEIFELADRITVMRDGAFVSTCEARAVTPGGLISQMTGRDLSEGFPPRIMEVGNTPVLTLQGGSSGSLRSASLSIFSGEVVGLTGLAGSGRSALLRVLAGAEPLTAGRLELCGAQTKISSPAGAWQSGIAFVPEERRTQGLMMSSSIRSNAMLPHLAAVSRWGFTNRPWDRAQVSALTKRVKLRARNLEEPVHYLSGGNQQKVLLARALAANPKVMLLDEPTRGVDVAAKHDIYTLIVEAAARGTAVLLASSDLHELLGLSHRILVMQEGRLTNEATTAGLSQTELLTLCFPEVAA